MKSFWNVAIRGGQRRAGPLDRLHRVRRAGRGRDADRHVLGGDVRVRAAQRDELAVVHVRAAVDELAHVHRGLVHAVGARVRQGLRRPAGGRVGLVVRFHVQEATRVVGERVRAHHDGLAGRRHRAARRLGHAFLGELRRRRLSGLGGRDLGLARFPRALVLDRVPDRVAERAQLRLLDVRHVDRGLRVVGQVADVVGLLELVDHLVGRCRDLHEPRRLVRRERRHGAERHHSGKRDS